MSLTTGTVLQIAPSPQQRHIKILYTNYMALKDTLFHRWLAIPYRLHTTIKQPATSKKIPTILFLHGIGNSGEAWDAVIERLPPNYRIVTIDLLGFGKSPKPEWMKYDARQQARAVVATYLRLRLRGRVIIVGHSLGSLVAVEIAKRYPLFVRSLILCSPPFYKVSERKRRLIPSSDTILNDIYRLASKHPEQFIKISVMALRLGLVNKSFNLTTDNADVYMNALESSIINQTSLKDAEKLTIPMQVIYGRLDPVVVLRNLHHLTKVNKHATLTTIIAAHEVKGHIFINAIISAIIETTNARKHP